jgi:hypothetical protein
MPSTVGGVADMAIRHDGPVPAVREILIGRRTGDHVLLAVRGRLFPEGDEADWLWVSLTVQSGGFGCRRDGNLQAADLRRFQAGLEDLQEGAATAAVLATEDDWLAIEMTPDGDDGVAARVRVRSDGPPPAELGCGLADLEPAGLVTTIESLADVERAYP